MTRITGNPDYQDPFGNTLLHGAAMSGDVREAELLLEAGARPDIANREGRTPLHVAALFGHRKLYRLLSRRQRTGASRPSDPRR
jgi:ankyrin repeat protein